MILFSIDRSYMIRNKIIWLDSRQKACELSPTYVNDLEQLAVGVEDEDLILAACGQQNVILHHQGYWSTVAGLRVIEVLKDRPLLEQIGQLAERQRAHLRDPVVRIVAVRALQRLPLRRHVRKLVIEVAHCRVRTLEVRLDKSVVFVHHIYMYLSD